MNRTCIQFVPLSDSDKDYVLFVEYSGWVRDVRGGNINDAD